MNKDFDSLLSKRGLVTCELENFDLVNTLKSNIKSVLKNSFGLSISELDEFHKFIDQKELNNIRLKLALSLNDNSYASDLIYSKLEDLLQNLLGPDIAIQKNVGLSIQTPGDSSSLLHVHSDVYDSDCSPYEIVIWIPLVNCYRTKSMFYLPFSHCESIGKYLELSGNLRKNLQDPEEINDSIEFMDIKPPSIALFSHSVWHGNKVNETDETRFSLNVRVKNLFTPYRGKKLGDFFKIAGISKLSKLASNIEVEINE